MKKLPAAIKHCQKILALRRQRVSVTATSFDLLDSITSAWLAGFVGAKKSSACNMGQCWDLQCDGAHTGLRFLPRVARPLVVMLTSARDAFQ